MTYFEAEMHPIPFSQSLRGKREGKAKRKGRGAACPTNEKVILAPLPR